MANIENIDFHHLKLSNNSILNTNENASNKREGVLMKNVSCAKCFDKCSGFLDHQWRHSCSNCNCAVWEHDVPVNKKLKPMCKMKVEEILPPLTSEYDKALTEGYLWIPRGLDATMIDKFMRHFDAEKIPKINSLGAKFRAKQICYQLPSQDFNENDMKHFKDNAIHSFKQFCKLRFEFAMGIGTVNYSLKEPVNCSRCRETVSPGHLGVFTEIFGAEYCWHPQCFSCCVDDEFLVDLVYFVHEQRIYCGRHWAEQIKPRCHACDELIYVGEYTKAMGNPWHLEHFCCDSCDTILARKKYVIVDNKPICQLCYDTGIAATCSCCKQLIGADSKDLCVKDRHYHKDCLNCIKCKSSLESQTFSFVNEEPVCHKCRGVDIENSKECKTCKIPFQSDEKKVFLNKDYFHEHCFLCSECKNAIGSEKFIHKSDGRQLCQACFQVTAKTCRKCERCIKSSAVKFEGETFHIECFLCLSCNKQLGGIQFYKKEDDPYCEDCFLSTYAKRCTACFDPIEGNTKFIDYDSKYWHSKCFICTQCSSTLAGTKFIIRNSNRYCMACK